ncbi:MAG TPA: MotA/TolQ/ExbB proton channel family protein [Burkholderiales bacterium]|nr:MotA/TolQ/ExbB proton channel family protein [Burkholderiales bacterium]
MLHIIDAAGWPIWLIIIASIIALGIIVERAWSLRRDLVAPRVLLLNVINDYQQSGVSEEMLKRLEQGPLLGQIFAAGLKNIRSPREVVKESLDEAGHAAAHELERFLTSLGTIAAISPLLGLFGTVIGMIEIFGSQTPTGGNPVQLAHGISIALYNTAFGIMVAIPSMIFYRYYRSKAETLMVEMEMQALKLIEIVHGERQE